MTSAAKRTANQANAARSTGPRTTTGKQTSSRNATKHGLLSQTPIILPGQEKAFQELEAGLRKDLQPCGTLQDILFQSILHAAWNVHRCRQFLAQLQAEATDPMMDILHDDGAEAKLHRIDLYRRRNESSFHRALQELRALQSEAHFRETSGQPLDSVSVLVKTRSMPRQAAPKTQPDQPQHRPEQTKPPAPAPRVELPPFVARQLAQYYPKAA